MKLEVQTEKQWQQYAQLELLPVVQVRSHIRSGLISSISGWLWGQLLNLFCRELLPDQRVSYLERCWADRSVGRSRIGRGWQQLRKLMATVLLT